MINVCDNIVSDYDDIRLDRYLKKIVPGVSQALIEKSLRKKLIKVNNQYVKSNCKVYNGDKISFPSNWYSISSRKVSDQLHKSDEHIVNIIQNSIIYEDDNVMAINKPTGIAVQGGNKVRVSIDNILAHMHEQFRLVHRLDKDTSGVLLVAKTFKMAKFLTEQFYNRTIKKTYRAITYGIPNNNFGKIEASLRKQLISGEEKIVVSNSPFAQQAITKFSILRKIHDKFAYLNITPLTGRKHQIRAHLAHINCPIVGDSKYNKYMENKDLNLQLHSYRISFTSLDGNLIKITAPVPEYMKSFTVDNF